MTEICWVSPVSFIDWETLQGVNIPFANLELMLRFKQSTREKDILDKNYLQQLKKSSS